jgi:ABC-type siderophore export system fused ATPase/permease subunit
VLEVAYAWVGGTVVVILSIAIIIIIIMSCAFTAEEVVDRLSVMRQQEDTSYAYSNWLPKGREDTCLNITWREKICQWSYNVVDQYVLK